MKNHNEILNSINNTINESHYSYTTHREKIGSPIKPVERKFINGPIEHEDGTVEDSSNHVINSTQAALEKGRLLYKEQMKGLTPTKGKFSEGEELNNADIDLIKSRSSWNPIVKIVSDDEAKDIADASSEFNPYATISDLAYGDESDGSFKIGNNLRGGSDDSNVKR